MHKRAFLFYKNMSKFLLKRNILETTYSMNLKIIEIISYKSVHKGLPIFCGPDNDELDPKLSLESEISP